MKTYRQGTNERRLYVEDFSDRLDSGDTIASVAWTADAGISTTESDHGDDWAEIVAYGGTQGTTYALQAVATTQEGRKHEKTFLIQVVDR